MANGFRSVVKEKNNTYILPSLSSRNRKVIWVRDICCLLWAIEQPFYLGYFRSISFLYNMSITLNNLNNYKHLLSYSDNEVFSDDSCKYLLSSMITSEVSTINLSPHTRQQKRTPTLTEPTLYLSNTATCS